MAFEVIIVGAGPVGLLLANLLGAHEVNTLVIDKRASGPEASMAIGLTPPSLRVLAGLHLDDAFVSAGIPIERAVIHGDRGVLGRLSFQNLPEYPFILSLPQAETVRRLAARLAAWPSVTLWRQAELVALTRDPDRVTATIRRRAAVQTVCSAFLVGADGGESRTRTLAAIPVASGTYASCFAMGDGDDPTDLGREAHLFFTADGSVESFPLPGNRRRWVVQTRHLLEDVPEDFLQQRVTRRTGLSMAGTRLSWRSAFQPAWQQAEAYCRGRVVLCGDAAHQMSPIGGQGMNVGFADAAWLATLLVSCTRQGQAHAPLLARYNRARRRAAQVATRRAARGMWLGTRRGPRTRLWRTPLLRLLLRPPFRPWLPPYFAMLTLPHNRPALEGCP